MNSSQLFNIILIITDTLLKEVSEFDIPMLNTQPISSKKVNLLKKKATLFPNVYLHLKLRSTL